MEPEERWPLFPCFGDLSPEEQDTYLSEAAESAEGRGFTNPVEQFRRRRRLLAPPLRIARLTEERFHTSWEAASSPGAIDVVLVQGHVAAMPDNRFEAKLVIGVDHQFSRGQSGLASHARVIEGEARHPLPLTNVPFMQAVTLRPGATLTVRIVFLDGKTGRAIVNFLKSDVFRSGIRLTASYNPVFGAATGYLSSLTQSLISSGKNRVVTQGTFGSSDYGSPIGGPLVVGDYLLAQLPEDLAGRIGELRLDRGSGRVMDGEAVLDANHLILRITTTAASG